MTVIVQLLGSLAATLTAYGLYKVLRMAYSELTSPLRDLPGPKSSSIIYGNFKEIWKEVRTNTLLFLFRTSIAYHLRHAKENSVPQERWIKEFGPTIQYKALFGVSVPSCTPLVNLTQDISCAACIPWTPRHWTMSSWTAMITRNLKPRDIIWAVS